MRTARLIKHVFLGAFCASLSLGFVACEEKPISALTAEEGIARIRATHSEEAWERVVQQVQEYRSRYPYSRFAAETELLLADALFQSGHYSEAAATYKDFLTRNPASEQADLVAFRIAQSYERQSPKDKDRGHSLTLRALQRYQSFVDSYAKSPYADEALQKIQALRRLLGEHELFVANFYWKKEQYSGALNRYLRILENYANFDDLRKTAQERAAQSYLELAQRLEKNPDSDELIYFRNNSPAELRKKAAELAPK